MWIIAIFATSVLFVCLAFPMWYIAHKQITGKDWYGSKPLPSFREILKRFENFF